MLGSYSWSWLHSSVSFCCSSQRETMCGLINDCPHAYKTFERMKRIREAVIIVSVPGPGTSLLKPVRITSRNKPKEGDTSLSQLICLCISYNCVFPPPEVFIQGGCFREIQSLEIRDMFAMGRKTYRTSSILANLTVSWSLNYPLLQRSGIQE